MTDVNEMGSDATPAGSPNKGVEDVPANGDKAGEASQNKESAKTEETVPMEQHKELETKLGQQGKDYGDTKKKLVEYEDFFEEITPVLQILNDDPELTKAIVAGKISSDLLESLQKGDVSPKEAEKITKAHEDVKKDLGTEGYEKASTEDIETMVSTRLKEESGKISEQVNKRISESEEKRDFQDSITEFINNTPDFSEHADAVKDWFDEHPSQTDITVAYEAVKGKSLEERYKNEEGERAAEAAKEVAANAGGGPGQQTGKISDEELVDKLIGRTSNPNVF